MIESSSVGVDWCVRKGGLLWYEDDVVFFFFFLIFRPVRGANSKFAARVILFKTVNSHTGHLAVC